jgi:uncharacterized protein (DUF362 family)
MDRRKFLALGVGAATAVAAVGGGGKNGGSGGKSVVAVVRSSGAKRIEGMTRAVYASLLSKALVIAAGTSEPASAARRIASKSDIVGFKLNLLAGPTLSPSVDMAAALADLFSAAGFDRGRLVFWERTGSELARCGFNARSTGAAVAATDEPGYGYEEEPEVSGEIGSCFSRLLTRRISALVSVGVVKDHDLSGVSCAAKNLYGCIHNPNKYHDRNCDPYIPDLLASSSIRPKLRLAVLDASKVQYDGGPLHKPDRCDFFGGVIVGTDIVAVDAVAKSIIEKARADHGLEALKAAGRDPTWLETAGKRGLGTASLHRIQVVEKVI